MDQSEITLRQAAINRGLNNQPRAANRLHTAANVATVVNVVSDFQLQHRQDEINQIFGAKMAPWNNWRAQEQQTINHVHAQSTNAIEEQFAWMKQRSCDSM
jgi:hypothetical protein